MSDAPANGHQIRPRRRFRRDESGLTTLEWLLIVAAVAGLAALAVVLVQNVVDDTAEQIGGSSARKQAAQVAAADINTRARNEMPTFGTVAATNQGLWSSKLADVTSECSRLKITYGDVENLTVTNPTDPTSWTVKATVDTAWQTAFGATSTTRCTVT